MQNILNDNFGLKNQGFSNSANTVDLARHRWYFYKEGFSPFLVEKAIEQTGLKKEDIILDPFNGGGTTTLTSSLGGYKSIGLEVNPFTSFIAKTKNKNAELRLFNDWKEKLLNIEINKKSNLLGFSTFSEKDGKDKWLFNDSILNTFESQWQALKNSNTHDDLREIFKLAMISSAIENCNARRDGKCFRYKTNWESKEYSKDNYIESLSAKLEKIKSDLTESTVINEPTIINEDCRIALKSKKLPFFKLCVTSPPYLNTFDYTDIYRPELFLGKFINTGKDLYNLRMRTVRSHVQAKWKKPLKSDFGMLYQQSINHVLKNKDSLMNPKIPLMIQAYFEDMYNILESLKHKAEKDAQLWLVVSNSAYADMEIPVDLIIGDIGSKLGWYLKEIGVLRYINKRQTRHSPTIKELRESVIIFSNSKL